MSSEIQIRISYKLNSEITWNEIQLEAEDYFDCEKDESIEESIPKYDHAIDYLHTIPKDSVSATKINIVYNQYKQQNTIEENFWNCGKNRVIEITDFIDEKIDYWELIIVSEISQDPTNTEIMRFNRNSDGTLKMLMHSIITENEDGTESVRSIL